MPISSPLYQPKWVDNYPALKPLQVQKILFSFIKVPYLREINYYYYYYYYYLPSQQGCTNFVVYPLCFFTAYKMTSRPSGLAWASDILLSSTWFLKEPFVVLQYFHPGDQMLFQPRKNLRNNYSMSKLKLTKKGLN